MSALDSIKSGINLAGNITNALTDSTLKQFYSLRDFYNFIRKEQNCPMQHKNFFTIVPQFNAGGSLSNLGNTLKSLGKSIGSMFGRQ